MSITRFLVRYTHFQPLLEEFGLESDSFKGMYELALFSTVLEYAGLNRVDQPTQRFALTTYRFLRTLDNLVDEGDPREAMPHLEHAITSLGDISSKGETGNRELDAVLAYRECIDIEQYVPTLQAIIETFKEDAQWAVQGGYKTRAELKSRAQRLMTGSYDLFSRMIGKGQFAYSGSFAELCYHHNGYAHITRYRDDIRSRHPQIPKEIVEENPRRENQKDYHPEAKRAFIKETMRGIYLNARSVFETNLPRAMQVGLFLHIITRPIKYHVKKFWRPYMK